MRRPLLCSALIIFTSLLTFTRASGEVCSASSQCPQSSPCCGVGGTCGSGALQCAGGCQPLASYSAGSCLPNPICSNKNITFAPSDYKNADMFRPILLYNGNSSEAPFTLDNGFLGQGPEGVLLELTAPTQTKLSTTDYVLYGNVELVSRHNAIQGLVFTMISMSDIKDEIDWEFTTSNGSEGFTNYFSEGVTVAGSSATVTGGTGFDVSDWHTYGINWQADSLQWSIDGNVVKSIKASTVGNNYPRSPSRIQISTWAGGNDTNPPGVVTWAGGAIDWTSSAYTSQGYYSAEIKSFSVTCASQTVNGVSTTGSGSNITSWVYTGQNSTTLDEPGFSLSTTPIKFLKNPSEDATPGLPGYTTQSDFTQSNKNAWDGSGDTSGLSAAEIGGSSSSGGWLDHNKTLSIVVPVAAGLVALIALWAIIVYCVKRRKKANGEYADHTKDSTTSAFNSTPTPLTNTRKSSLYNKLDDDDNDNEGEYYEEEEAVPMGAQKIGAGYGPAVGPSPGQMMNSRREYSDSTSSLHDTRSGYQGGGVVYSAQSPALSQYTATGVRGPYTPAMNAYTPAIRQTPAMRQTPVMGSNNQYSTPQPGYSAYATPNYQTQQPRQPQYTPSQPQYGNAGYSQQQPRSGYQPYPPSQQQQQYQPQAGTYSRPQQSPYPQQYQQQGNYYSQQQQQQHPSSAPYRNY